MTTLHIAESYLSVPEESDFEDLAMVKALAFAEKSWQEPDVAARESGLPVLIQSAQIGKLAHCRVFKNENGRVLGGIQLQLHGDVGNLELPEGFRHELQPGEAYVEWIGCHPEATGMGIGSRLLAWADAYAASQGALFLSLEVMKKNDGAVRLYERKGYVVTSHGSALDRFIGSLFVFFALGFKYWTVLYMQKQLVPPLVSPPSVDVNTRTSNVILVH